eukprot:COSAG01_NODE_1416_length_10373_cov_4.944984_4_plen_237_part_00
MEPVQLRAYVHALLAPGAEPPSSGAPGLQAPAAVTAGGAESAAEVAAALRALATHFGEPAAEPEPEPEAEAGVGEGTAVEAAAVEAVVGAWSRHWRAALAALAASAERDLGSRQAALGQKAVEASSPFPSWHRRMLTEIYLCHACPCHEVLFPSWHRCMLAEIYLCHACSFHEFLFPSWHRCMLAEICLCLQALFGEVARRCARLEEACAAAGLGQRLRAQIVSRNDLLFEFKKFR